MCCFREYSLQVLVVKLYQQVVDSSKVLTGVVKICVARPMSCVVPGVQRVSAFQRGGGFPTLGRRNSYALHIVLLAPPSDPLQYIKTLGTPPP